MPTAPRSSQSPRRNHDFPAASTNFVETAAVQDLRNRALGYLRAGFPVHFRGPAGSGKTTLAFHVAAQLGRPVVFLTGDDEMTTSNLVGGQFGYQYRKVVDRFIHTVLKYEEDATRQWSDNRLTTACREGHTLIYDEFTRSRPEANNILLGVLEESACSFCRSPIRTRAMSGFIPTFARSSPAIRRNIPAFTMRRTR